MHWFHKTDSTAYNITYWETYKINRYRTERFNKKPIQHMRRLLNNRTWNNEEGHVPDYELRSIGEIFNLTDH